SRDWSSDVCSSDLVEQVSLDGNLGCVEAGVPAAGVRERPVVLSLPVDQTVQAEIVEERNRRVEVAFVDRHSEAVLVDQDRGLVARDGGAAGPAIHTGI